LAGCSKEKIVRKLSLREKVRKLSLREKIVLSLYMMGAISSGATNATHGTAQDVLIGTNTVIVGAAFVVARPSAGQDTTGSTDALSAVAPARPAAQVDGEQATGEGADGEQADDSGSHHPQVRRTRRTARRRPGFFKKNLWAKLLASNSAERNARAISSGRFVFFASP
jgi:hypothetical protein